MANKEAVFILLDVGATMHEQYQNNDGEDQRTRLDVSIDCIKEYIQQKLFNSTQCHIGIILCGTDQADDGNTQYIQEIEKPDANLVRNIMELKEHEVPEMKGGDVFDAIDKTIATLDQFVGKKKFSKTIFLFTNGGGQTDYNEAKLRQLAKSAQSGDVKINVTALDFANNYEPGCELDEIEERDENQSDIQNQNQGYLCYLKKQMPNKIEIYPSKLAIQLYSQFKTKQATNRVYFRGSFEITPEIIVQMEIYKKTSELKLPPLKKYSKQADFNANINSGTITKDTIEFLQDDPQMEPVEKEDVIKGFYYGKNLVPITKTFEEQMQFVTQKGIKLLGFTDKSQIARHQFIKDVECIIPVASAANQNAINSLIHACYQTKKVAIVRFCYRDKTTPKLCALFPHIAANYECFYMTELPTSESVRDYQFNSLKESTPEQQQAVANLIDKMDLMNVKEDQEDDDDDATEALQLKSLYNPTRQYFFQTIMHKAFKQQDENQEQNADQDIVDLPPVNQTIQNYLRPEQKIYDQAQQELQNLQQVFALEERELTDEKEKKVFWRDLINNQDLDNQDQNEQQQQLVEMTEEERQQLQDVKKGKFAFDDEQDIVKVSETTPIEDFRKMIENKKDDLVDTAIQQLSEMIIKFVVDSFQGSQYKKALACLKELRKVCIKEEEVGKFNDFLKQIKGKFASKSDSKGVGFWKMVVESGVTLIISSENDKSDISLEAALQFNKQNSTIVQQIQPQQLQQETGDNLEDEID